MKNPKNTLERQKKLERRAKKAYALAIALTLSMAVTIVPAFAANDPLQIVSNLSDFIFSLIRAVGLILLGTASCRWACPSSPTTPPSAPTVC